MAIKISGTTVIDDSRNLNAGIITATTINATTFVGSGSGLTGAGSTVFIDTTTNQEFFPLFTSTTSGTITASGISTSKLKYNPSTGTVTATTFVGALTGTASTTTNIPNLTGAITSINTTTSLGSFSSSNLATALTDETGSGSAVFATSPTLVTPVLGNAAATSVNVSGIVTAAQFVTGASGSAIGINTNTISGPSTITIDPAAVGNDTGLVVIKGDLQIDGTTTTINSTTMTVDDKNIVLGSGAANDAAADGSGITIESAAGNKTFQFQDTGDNLGSSENLNVASGKVYKVNNTEVLSSTTLGSGIVNSSLTSVGTLTNLSVGNVNSSGIITATSFVGALTGTATSTTNIPNLTGDITSVNKATTLATVNSNVGTFGSGGAIPTITVNAKGLVTGVTTTAVNPANDGTLTLAVSGTGLSGSQTFSANQSSSVTFTVTSNATNANTASAIVARDASGNFSAGTITASLTGTASNVTTNANLTGDVTSSGNATSIAAGVIVDADVNASAAISLSKLATTGTLTATTFVGALTGNASSATTATNLSGGSLTNYSETTNAVGNTGAAATINLANGNFVTATLTGNCTWTFTTGVATNAVSFTLLLANDATASRTITWPAAVVWPGGTVPTRTTTASKTDVYSFFTTNNGTKWYGNIAQYNYT